MKKNEVMKQFNDEVFKENGMKVFCHDNKGIFIEIQNQNGGECIISLNAESSFELLHFLNKNIRKDNCCLNLDNQKGLSKMLDSETKD